MKRFLEGALTLFVLAFLIGLATVGLGLVGVNADGSHSKIEARIMPLALHSSVARHAVHARAHTACYGVCPGVSP